MSEADIHVDFGTVELHIELIELGRENIPAHGYPNIFETIFGPSNKRLQSKLDPKLGMAKTYFMWVCRRCFLEVQHPILGDQTVQVFFLHGWIACFIMRQ